jgi:hypothetical protein
VKLTAIAIPLFRAVFRASFRASFCAVFCVASACSRAAPPTPAGADAAPPRAAVPADAAPAASAADDPDGLGPAVPDAVARMTLLDPGRPPRRKLRYDWGHKRGEALTMDLRTSASTDDGASRQPEIALPPVHLVIAIDPREVSPAGDLTYAWRVTSTSVRSDAQTPSTVADGMRAEVAAIEHLSGTATISARGLSARVTIDPVPLADGPGDGGATGQMIEQVRQTLRDVAAPFPEEEVGRGARWEKVSRLASRDARVSQTETFTLTDLAGDAGSLDDLLAQTAPAQPLLSPGPGASQARMESMRASGDGKTRFDLGRLVPQTTFEGTTTMVVSGHLHEGADPGAGPQDDSRRMTMTMRMGIVLAGTLR